MNLPSTSNITTESKPWLFLTGGHGFIGQTIQNNLSHLFQVFSLRRTGSTHNPNWDYQSALKDCRIDRPEAIIHLAGAPTDGQRWTQKYRKQLLESRVNGTQNLLTSIKQSGAWPKTLITASAIGYYGHRPNEILDESSSHGDLFVSSLATQWEQPVTTLGASTQSSTRTVTFRLGMVVGAHGGALKKMLLPFKLGLGASMGSGQQMYSWISIEDVVGVIKQAITNPNYTGIYNAVSPHSINNNEFTQSLAKHLRRPAWFNIPAPVIKMLYGQMGQELLLADLNVKPQRLMEAGYSFIHPTLTTCFENVIP